MFFRVAVLAGSLVAAPVLAQVAATPPPPPPEPKKLTLAQLGLFIYPAKEQSPEQQKLDEDACYQWAETNTGLIMVAGTVDTEAAGKAAASQAGQGAVAKGAAGGAVAGVAIGAIAGDAGKGAAIGAVAGSMGGLRGRHKAKQAAGQAGAQQAVEANQAAVDKFKRAASACLDARGYSVK
ncbi:MAG TPA: hypothetical protein VLD67_10145 [Vicinamibacterales bacterium]|nr:hypothetical protein [Vicinamibacterales bacterium]